MNRDAEWFDALVQDGGAFDPFTAAGWRTLGKAFERMVGEAVPRSSSGSSEFLGQRDPEELRGTPRNSEELPAGARLLDIGCGTGSSRTIYTRAGRYVGLDHSYAAVRFARSSDTSALWLGGDALELPFADASFDVVAFSSVLHHLPDRTRALREARRVLRPGGRVFAFDPNLLHPALALFRHPASPLYRPEGVSPEERPLLASQLARSFREAGLTDIRQRAQANIPYRQVAVGALDRLLPLYNALDWLMDRSGLGRWFGSFVLTAARRAD